MWKRRHWSLSAPILPRSPVGFTTAHVEVIDDDGTVLAVMIDEGQSDDDVDAQMAADERRRTEDREAWRRIVDEEFGGDEDAAQEAVWSTSLAQRQQPEIEVSQAFDRHRQEVARIRRSTDDLRRDAPG